MAAFAIDPATVVPGWGALVLLIVLTVVTFLLWRSMRVHTARVQAPRAGEVRGSEHASRIDLRRR